MKLYFKYTSLALVIIVSVFMALYTVYKPQSIPTIADTDTADVTDTSFPDTEDTEPPETEPPIPKKRVALTFDDGPAYDNDDFQRLTYKLVDKLNEYGGKATFFLVGNRINKTTGQAISYAAQYGNEIGVHAYTHSYNFSNCDYSVFLDELEKTKAKIETYSGKEVTLFRPPYGAITGSRAKDSGYPIILWNIDSEDWVYKSRDDSEAAEKNIAAIVENIISQVKDGDIILMHEIYQNSYEAACIVIDTLTAEGYEFVTVTEIIGEENLKIGQIYYSGASR